jgi:hypothetical protein
MLPRRLSHLMVEAPGGRELGGPGNCGDAKMLFMLLMSEELGWDRTLRRVGIILRSTSS